MSLIRKNIFKEVDVPTDKEFVVIHIIKFVTFLTCWIPDKNITMSTRIKFMRWMDNSSIAKTTKNTEVR